MDAYITSPYNHRQTCASILSLKNTMDMIKRGLIQILGYQITKI